MRHRVSGRKFNRDTKERKALFKSLVANFILYEKIKTTSAKAKEVRSITEKLIVKAKENDLSARRDLMSYLGQKNVVNKLLEVVGQSFEDRKSGFTRIINLGARKGDNAPMVELEFTSSPSEKIVVSKAKFDEDQKKPKRKTERQRRKT